jgi:hypothetical protein
MKRSSNKPVILHLWLGWLVASRHIVLQNDTIRKKTKSLFLSRCGTCFILNISGPFQRNAQFLFSESVFSDDLRQKTRVWVWRPVSLEDIVCCCFFPSKNVSEWAQDGCGPPLGLRHIAAFCNPPLHFPIPLGQECNRYVFVASDDWIFSPPVDMRRILQGGDVQSFELERRVMATIVLVCMQKETSNKTFWTSPFLTFCKCFICTQNEMNSSCRNITK